MSHWKTEIADLKNHALPVLCTSPGQHPDSVMSARTAARALSGAVRFLSIRFGEDAMQMACAEIVRSSEAWRTSLRVLPNGPEGSPSVPVALLGAVAAGILQVCGEGNTRAALAFWACETDRGLQLRVSQRLVA